MHESGERPEWKGPTLHQFDIHEENESKKLNLVSPTLRQSEVSFPSVILYTLYFFSFVMQHNLMLNLILKNQIRIRTH